MGDWGVLRRKLSMAASMVSRLGLGSGGGGLWQVGRRLLLVGPGPTWRNHCPDGAEREWQCDAGVLAWFSHVAAAVL